METYRAIVTKRDTRAFDSKPIPEDVLGRILQAGRMAGSAKAAEPVRAVVVRAQAQKEALAACGRFTPQIPTCAAAVVLVLVPEPDQPPGQFAYFRGPFDAGRAGQNIMLAAWSEGIASCPVTLHDNDCARAVLGLPEGHLVANVIALGYPGGKDPTTGSRPRMPVEQYVRWERWG
ncbi:MAG: nitroreductase family protein [Chloroflexi bacterium]|nr:nitroreductase family protein [Chloroflexota bacterium]